MPDSATLATGNHQSSFFRLDNFVTKNGQPRGPPVFPSQLIHGLYKKTIRRSACAPHWEATSFVGRAAKICHLFNRPKNAVRGDEINLVGGAITILKTNWKSMGFGWHPIYGMEKKIHVPNTKHPTSNGSLGERWRCARAHNPHLQLVFFLDRPRGTPMETSPIPSSWNLPGASGAPQL